MVLNPDKNRHYVGPDLGPMLVLIWDQTVCKGYQQTTEVAACKERVKTISKLCTYLLMGESLTNEAVENLSCDCMLIS